MKLEYFGLAMDFVHASREIDTLEELGAAFQKVNVALGFDHFACLSCVEFGSMPEEAFFLADCPAHWSDVYLEEHFGRTDRVLQISLREHMPFNWDRAAPPVSLSDADGGQGLIYGITVPVHVVGAFPGTVNVVGHNRDMPPEAEHAVHLMSVYLHDAAMKLAQKEERVLRQPVKLTPRERECLQWVAAGKTDWEIAGILSLSERTVHNHIESAKSKLHANSRVQAVVKAFLSNLIY